MSSTLIERIQAYHDSRNPFVIYRKPGESAVRLILQKDRALHYLKSYLQTGFIMAPFNSRSRPVLIYPDQIHDLYFEEEQLIMDLPSSMVREESVQKRQYIALVSRAVKAIKSGKLQKVVISREISFPYPDIPIKAFTKLLKEHPQALCYLWYHPEIGIWLGATPELLLSVHQNSIKTYALAGTLPDTGGVEPEWGIKEVEEQEMVTRYIQDLFSKLSIPTKAGPVCSVRAGRLWHLKTEITGGLEGHQLEDIVRALHPTPAVCGLPKDKALNFLKVNESYNRQYYTGFLGELNWQEKSTTNLYVNLRCMKWEDQLATIYVGGGITNRSMPEDEWRETQQKSSTIMEALFNSQK